MRFPGLQKIYTEFNLIFGRYLRSRNPRISKPRCPQSIRKTASYTQYCTLLYGITKDLQKIFQYITQAAELSVTSSTRMIRGSTGEATRKICGVLWKQIIWKVKKKEYLTEKTGPLRRLKRQQYETSNSVSR